MTSSPGKELRVVGPGLAAAMALGLLVAGVPLLLAYLVGGPLPGAVPDWGSMQEALDRPTIPTSLIVKVFGGLYWLTYAALLLCLLLESISLLRGRLAPSIGVLEPFQRAVRWLLDAVTRLWLSRSQLGQPVQLPPLAQHVRRMTADHDLRKGDGTPLPAAAWPDPRPGSLTEAAERVGGKVYVVEAGRGRHRQTLWRVAQEHLGDGRRWREILELNRERVQADDSKLSESSWLEPGWRLVMPADAFGLPEAPEGRDAE